MKRSTLLIWARPMVVLGLLMWSAGCGGAGGGSGDGGDDGGDTTTSDFTPCSGKPTNPTYVETLRLMTATSPDGLAFTRTSTILNDRASVPDAVVLPSGRILAYYVVACKIVGGAQETTNEIVAAVSDDDGTSWAYKDVTFNGVPAGATPPVDPNAVLKPDGNVRLFVTIDPDPNDVSVKARTYSFLSTDGGFTYDIEGERFAVAGADVLDPENYRFSDTSWKIWAGTRYATSADGNTFTDQGAINVALDDQGNPFIVAEIAATADAGIYRMYVHCDLACADGIRSLVSTNTTDWTLEAGSRLTVDPSGGLESDGVKFPTVVRMSNGTYLMVYQTTIP